MDSALYTPIILGCVSLLAWLSLRNTNISEHLRAATRDLYARDLVPERGASLIRQIHLFKRRFRYSNAALIVVILATLAFITMMVASKRGYDGAFTAAAAGICLIIAALLLTGYEIALSIQTLFEDSDSALAYYEETRPSSRPS